MLLAKLFLAAMIVLVVTDGTFSTGNSQTCSNCCNCCSNNDAPRTTPPQPNTLTRGKAGPKGPKGDAGEPGNDGRQGRRGRTGRDFDEAGIERIIESSVNERYEEMHIKLDAANDKINGLEDKIHMLISATSTTTENTTTTITLSDEERVNACGAISTIPNSGITASSIYNDYPDWGTQHSRLYSTSGLGGWSPDYPFEGSWIELDLGRDQRIRGVATQGQHGSDFWTRSYSIAIKTSTSSSFQNIQDQSGAKKIFQGNADTDSVVINNVDTTARHIRIYPLTWNAYAVLRFDILKC